MSKTIKVKRNGVWINIPESIVKYNKLAAKKRRNSKQAKEPKRAS